MPIETKTPAFARVAGSMSMGATTATAKSSVRNFELNVIGESFLFVSEVRVASRLPCYPERWGLFGETQYSDACC
jgi:hypothetical protein